MLELKRPLSSYESTNLSGAMGRVVPFPPLTNASRILCYCRNVCISSTSNTLQERSSNECLVPVVQLCIPPLIGTCRSGCCPIARRGAKGPSLPGGSLVPLGTARLGQPRKSNCLGLRGWALLGWFVWLVGFF